jgi:hypothetical protein
MCIIVPGGDQLLYSDVLGGATARRVAIGGGEESKTSGLPNRGPAELIDTCLSKQGNVAHDLGLLRHPAFKRCHFW